MWASIIEWVLGMVARWFTGKRKDAQLATATQAAQTAEAKDAQAEVIIHNEEVRHAVDQSVQAEPEAPPQRVGDAVPDTAAGKLHSRWSRDG